MKFIKGTVNNDDIVVPPSLITNYEFVINTAASNTVEPNVISYP